MLESLYNKGAGLTHLAITNVSIMEKPANLFRIQIQRDLILILSWRRPLSYRNQSIDLLCKSMDWFLYNNSLLHERVKWDNMRRAFPYSKHSVDIGQTSKEHTTFFKIWKNFKLSLKKKKKKPLWKQSLMIKTELIYR